MEQFIKDIILVILSITASAIVTAHYTKRKDRKDYDSTIQKKFDDIKCQAQTYNDKVEENFERLWKRIELIIKALMNSNGAGVKFAEAYEKELKRSEQESQFQLK